MLLQAVTTEMARKKRSTQANANGDVAVLTKKNEPTEEKEDSPLTSTSTSRNLWVIVAVVFGAIISFLYPSIIAPVAVERSLGDDESPPIIEPLRVHDHFTVLEILPHDPKAFTQGLTYGAGKLWEGTGLYGESELRHIDPSTGNVLAKTSLDSKMFGEGISYYETQSGQGRLIQFSWKEKTGWIYNADTLELIKEFIYETVTGQGWGITYNPKKNEFIVTDGSAHLLFWDAETLQETKRLTVKYVKHDGTVQEVRHLNEVEYLEDGTILSNVWYQNILIKINLDTAMVDQVYDFKDLYVDRAEGADCFNGISVTDKPNELWVTGKLWPHMYRVKLFV